MCKKSFKTYHEVDLPIYVQIRQQPPNSHQHARRWVYIGSTHSRGNLHHQDNGLHPNPILQLPLTNWEKGDNLPINHTSIIYRPINNIVHQPLCLEPLLAILLTKWNNNMSPVPRFPWNKGDLPETNKLWNLTKFRLVRNPREMGPRVRLSKAGVGSHRPTPYVGHQADKGAHLPGGSVQQRQWLRSPRGFEVGWYIYLPYMKTIKKIQPFMWVRHILPVLWMALGNGHWTLWMENGYHIYLKVINPLSR